MYRAVRELIVASPQLLFDIPLDLMLTEVNTLVWNEDV